jgi:uncharacterized protein
VPAVSNSSPLIYHSALGDLTLLRVLLGRIIIPEEVFQEVVVRGQNQRGQREIASAVGDWLDVKPVMNCDRLRTLTNQIHLGEAEAIVLAQDLGLPVLLDDRRAVQAARLTDLR